MLVPLLIAGAVGYLLGAIPCGFLVARAKGVNIFEVGSKNPGATNVRRMLGRGPGNLVFALDALKGAAAAAAPLAWFFLTDSHGAIESDYVRAHSMPCMVAGLVAALLGHAFSCFTRFRGGKGVATATGGFFVLFPTGVLMAAMVWALTAWTTKYVSLASMLASIALAAAAWLLHAAPVILWACVAVMVFVMIRHRANIVRLASGTETKIGQKRAERPSP